MSVKTNPYLVDLGNFDTKIKIPGMNFVSAGVHGASAGKNSAGGAHSYVAFAENGTHKALFETAKAGKNAVSGTLSAPVKAAKAARKFRRKQKEAKEAEATKKKEEEAKKPD